VGKPTADLQVELAIWKF